MTLERWRRQNRLTYRELAKRLGVSCPGQVQRWCKRKNVPRKMTRARIARVTNYAVALA